MQLDHHFDDFLSLNDSLIDYDDLDIEDAGGLMAFLNSYRAPRPSLFTTDDKARLTFVLSDEIPF